MGVIAIGAGTHIADSIVRAAERLAVDTVIMTGIARCGAWQRLVGGRIVRDVRRRLSPRCRLLLYA